MFCFLFLNASIITFISKQSTGWKWFKYTLKVADHSFNPGPLFASSTVALDVILWALCMIRQEIRVQTQQLDGRGTDAGLSLGNDAGPVLASTTQP